MPALEAIQPENNEESAPINPVIGIIYPPPEVRSILTTLTATRILLVDCICFLKVFFRYRRQNRQFCR